MSVGEAVKDDGGRFSANPSVCIRGKGILDLSGDMGRSAGGGLVAVSSMLIVGARGRPWPLVAGGGGSSGLELSGADIVVRVGWALAAAAHTIDGYDAETFGGRQW